MKRKLNRISIAIVATVMFAGTLFLSIEQNEEGKWEIAAISAFAQSENQEGYQTVIIQDMGPTTVCEAPDLYSANAFSSLCLGFGKGTLPCPGNFVVLGERIGTCGETK